MFTKKLEIIIRITERKKINLLFLKNIINKVRPRINVANAILSLLTYVTIPTKVKFYFCKYMGSCSKTAFRDRNF